MEYCEGGSLDAIYRRIKQRKGRTGEKVLGKVAEAVSLDPLEVSREGLQCNVVYLRSCMAWYICMTGRSSTEVLPELGTGTAELC